MRQQAQQNHDEAMSNADAQKVQDGINNAGENEPGFRDDEIDTYDNLVNAATKQRIQDVLNEGKPNAKASAQTGNMTDKTRKAVIDGKTTVADLPDDDK